MRYPGFIGNFNQSQSINANPEDTLNWYFEPLPQNAKNQGALYPTEGFQSFVATSNIGGRGGIAVNGRGFVVMGGVLYETFSGQTVTNRGSVSQDSYPATLSSNGAAGNQLFITSGGNGYCYDLTTNVLTQVLTGDATMGGSLDGYFIAFNIATSKIRISDLNDGLTWDPTQFAQRGSSPDSWQAMFVVQQPAGVWLFGSQTGDVWYDAGSFPFPFAPIPGASHGYGIAAPFAFTVLGDRVTWVSQSVNGAGIVVTARGYSPQRVSTHPVETVITGYIRNDGISDCEAFGYERNGHQFSVFSFTRSLSTLVYDATTNAWHRRGYWDAPNNREDVWFPRMHLYAFNRHLIAGRSSSTIAEMDDTFGTELDGTPIVRQRIAPGVFSERRQIPFRLFEIYLESGLGTATGQGSDPQIMLQTSDNGGHTYGNIRTASAGKMGEYQRRARFWRMGVSRDRVYKLTVSDPIPWRIVDAYLNNDGQAAGAA